MIGVTAWPARAAEDAVADAAPIHVDDFEAPEISPRWTATLATLHRISGAAGGALEIRGAATTKDAVVGAGVALPIRDLRRIGAISLRISVSDGPGSVQIFLRQGATARTLEELIDFRTTEWRQLTLPLRHMSGGSAGLLPDPAHLDRLEIQWDGPGGVVRIDDLRLLPGDRGEESWRVQATELLAMAFGEGKGRLIEGRNFVLLVNTPAWQSGGAATFLADLERSVAMFRSVWGVEPAEGPRIPIVCWDEFNASWDLDRKIHSHFLAKGLRFSNALDRGCPEHATARGIPRELSPGKPATTGMHLYLARALRTSGSNWIVEGLVTALRRRVHGAIPQRRLRAEDFRERLRGGRGSIPPRSELLDGRAGAAHPDALASVFEFLASRHRGRLTRVWEAVRALEVGPDEDRANAIAIALGVTERELEDQWLNWGAANWK